MKRGHRFANTKDLLIHYHQFCLPRKKIMYAKKRKAHTKTVLKIKTLICMRKNKPKVKDTTAKKLMDEQGAGRLDSRVLLTLRAASQAPGDAGGTETFRGVHMHEGIPPAVTILVKNTSINYPREQLSTGSIFCAKKGGNSERI